VMTGLHWLWICASTTAFIYRLGTRLPEQYYATNLTATKPSPIDVSSVLVLSKNADYHINQHPASPQAAYHPPESHPSSFPCYH
jgi:hypothetical protein